VKRSSIALIGGCALLVLPVAAFASGHSGSGHAAASGGTHAAVCTGCDAHVSSSVGARNSNSSVTFSSLVRSERVGVNCATDKQCLLLQLRTQGLELKEKDGGNLTPEHRAELQAQLDLINARYH